MRADGTLYEEKGTLDFSDYSVNPTTGAVAFRGKVANPDRVLLPGMYVNVRLTVGTLNKGFRVPQLAVQRDGQGPFVLVVGADGMVAQKRVETVVGRSTTTGSFRAASPMATRSSSPDLQKVQPGMPAKAKPWSRRRAPKPAARPRKPRRGDQPEKRRPPPHPPHARTSHGRNSSSTARYSRG